MHLLKKYICSKGCPDKQINLLVSSIDFLWFSVQNFSFIVGQKEPNLVTG